MTNEATDYGFVSAAGSGQGPAFPIVPAVQTDEWLREFEAQATTELYEKATRYATERARQIAEVGGHVDDDYVHEVVQAAFADTYIGTLTWTPCASLEQHVIHAIKSRTRHDRERAMERRHVSLNLQESTPLVEEVEASLSAAQAGTVATAAARALASASMAVLRALASGRHDEDVLRLLDAFDDGVFAKQDILARTGISMRRYRNARNRLARYVQQLPADVRDAAENAA
jgi:hypothetical protein